MSHSHDDYFIMAPSAAPWHPAEPTEAELLAIDRTHSIATEMGVIDLMGELRALLLLQIDEDALEDIGSSYGGSD